MMQIVDTALQKAAALGSPVRVGLVGAGYSGRVIANQIIKQVPGIRICAIADRVASKARDLFRQAGVEGEVEIRDGKAVDPDLAKGRRVVTEDVNALCRADYLDVIIDATGSTESGGPLALEALENRKHLISINVELDSTLGPLLGAKAREVGRVYSNIDGDEPGVAMNLVRWARGMGLIPVLVGNLKGLYDPYRNPDTQAEFARARGQRPTTMTHFADGTKLAMELTVMANATGFQVARRGCYGPELPSVEEAADYFESRLRGVGLVDFLVGARPGNGVFLLCRASTTEQRDYLEYFKMGPGPLYTFYIPFHLPHLELSNTVARAALFGDATVSPLGGPVCETVAVAKRDLKEGEVLDGIGGFCTYGLIENHPVCTKEDLLPMGISGGCRLRRKVARDVTLTYADVELPPGRQIDRLLKEQRTLFNRSED